MIRKLILSNKIDIATWTKNRKGEKYGEDNNDR